LRIATSVLLGSSAEELLVLLVDDLNYNAYSHDVHGELNPRSKEVILAEARQKQLNLFFASP